MIQFSIRTFLYRLSQIRYFRHKKVDFIVIGAQKSGTSSLRHYLGRHPHISMSYTKEPHFFDDASYSSHPLSYYWYEKDFYQGDHDKLLGEVTPILSYLPEAPGRIKAYNSKIKLIMLLRNPIDRAFSHWNMEVERGNEAQDFLYCITHEQERLRSTEQLLFVKYEDYVNRQEAALTRIFDFLGVPSSTYEYKAQSVHKRTYNRQITQEEKEVLLSKYDNDISQLEELLDWDCIDWRKC